MQIVLMKSLKRTSFMYAFNGTQVGWNIGIYMIEDDWGFGNELAEGSNSHEEGSEDKDFSDNSTISWGEEVLYNIL